MDSVPHTEDTCAPRLPVVGIGASAGGLEAIGDVLEQLPANTGLAYLVVSHLDPTQESLLAPILKKRAVIPVMQAEDGLELAPNHIYVIPPAMVMTLASDRVVLTARDATHSPHLPINALFKSLAERGGRAVAVVLSGSGSDGAEGIKAVKEAAGIVIAQDPASSAYRGMPESAIQTGCVDRVLAPREIGVELTRIGTHPYLQASPTDGTSEAEPDTLHADEISPVFGILIDTYKADFSQYKPTTIHRRLRRRMALRQVETLAEYVDLLKQDAGEVAALYDDLLIRVTSFFRDAETFDGLFGKVFPAICENRTRSDPLRIWVPGCASGEEVYSIAMTLLEYLGERITHIPVQLFGTDLSEAAIEQARAGRYPEIISENVSPRRLHQFFEQEANSYRIAKAVRQLCLFARHNVARDPPFAKIDLVSCCNMLIYMGPAMQRQVIRNFHYALKPNGFLRLGPADAVGDSLYFQLDDPPYRLYTRQPIASRARLDADLAVPLYTRPASPTETPRAIADMQSLQRRADGLLLSRFAPASILVDERMNVVQFRGDTSPFIEHASGAASLNLHRMARSGMLLQLLAAIQEARDSGERAQRSGVRVESGSDIRETDVDITPITDPATGTCSFLVVFDANAAHDSRADELPAPLSESEKDRRIAQLEREATDVREYIDAMSAAHEAAHEEAHSAVEELLSTNEEFQSANEELETTKEELHSTNEELTTTNEELLHRTRELGVLNADLQARRGATELARRYADAIIETVAHPLLILDATLVVQRANRSFYECFRTVPSETLQQPIFGLGNGQWNIAELRALLLQVLEGREPVVSYRMVHEFQALGLRTMRLHANKVVAHDGAGEQVLLAIEDVTGASEMNVPREAADRRKDEFLAMLAHELRNPLAPIANVLCFLQQTVHDESTLRNVAMMERQVNVMTRLLDDLMDVSRITHGLIKIELEPVDLRTVVSDAVSTAKVYLDTRRHHISVSMPDQSVIVQADSIRLEQVIGNLLSNAAKYMDPGGQVSVTVSTCENDAVLTVKDSGIGLLPGVIPHIFDLFMQADASPGRSRGGLGIGLTLVRRLTELQGGSVSARSEGLGRGTEFEVRLPLVATRAPPRVPTQRLSRASAGRRVLVVDDNVDAALSIVELLKLWGHETAHAHDGLSAIELARSFLPDVALLDIGLPDIDGYSLAGKCRQIAGLEGLHLVAMTGYGQPADRAAAIAAGFDVHLVKPVALGTLQTLVASVPQRAS